MYTNTQYYVYRVLGKQIVLGINSKNKYNSRMIQMYFMFILTK